MCVCIGRSVLLYDTVCMCVSVCSISKYRSVYTCVFSLSTGIKGSVLPNPPSHPHTPHPPPPHTSQQHKPHNNKRHAPSALSLGSFLTTPTATPRQHTSVDRPQRSNRKTTAELRQAELEQLETRFHGNHQLVEKGRERCVYRVTFAPTDPDWVSNDVTTLSCDDKVYTNLIMLMYS